MISKGNHVNFARFVLLAVSEEAETWLPSFCVRSMYNKTIIGWGFCDIQNNQGRGKSYQPKPNSTNCNTIQIWSWCSRYLSSVASYVGRKSEVRKCRHKDLKMLGCFVINLLNNKTIIMFNRAEYRLILADSAYGRRIIVKISSENWIRSDEGLTLETSASESLYGGPFTLLTQLIKPNYLVILPATQHHSFFRNLPPLFLQYQ